MKSEINILMVNQLESSADRAWTIEFHFKCARLLFHSSSQTTGTLR